MTAMEDQDQDPDQGTTTTTSSTTTSMKEEEEKEEIRKWNLGGLRKEVSRLTVRCHKKIGKANQRIQKAKLEVERLLSKDGVITDEEFDSCPNNIDQLQQDLVVLQTRLQQLNQLEVLLQDVKGGKKNGVVVLPDHISSLVISLDVNDEPLTSNPQSSSAKNNKNSKTKEKGPKNMTPFRRPYRRYYTSNKTEIRVGKQANDNDELSLNVEHRDSLDWWMHASGCPGSHVVIRCHDQSLDEDVVQDAAALAARQSKCNGSVIKVSLTRARDVKKPPGAKAGLVQLTGDVKTVSVNMKDAQYRLDRLDKTVLIN